MQTLVAVTQTGDVLKLLGIKNRPELIVPFLVFLVLGLAFYLGGFYVLLAYFKRRERLTSFRRREASLFIVTSVLALVGAWTRAYDSVAMALAVIASGGLYITFMFIAWISLMIKSFRGMLNRLRHPRGLLPK